MTLLKPALFLCALLSPLSLVADNPAPPVAASTPQPVAAPAAAPADPFIKKNAPDPADSAGPKANLFFTFEFYRLGQTEAAKLLLGDATDQQRYDQLRDLVKNGKARMDEVMCGSQADGEQVSLEEINIFAYPLSFWLSGAAKTPFASDFKKRNIGRRLVIKSQTLTGNKACDLNIFPEETTLHGFIDRRSQIDGTAFTVPQPVFAAQRINTKPPLLPFDQVSLIGTISPAESDSLPANGAQSKEPEKDPETGVLFARASRVQYDPGSGSYDKFAGVKLELTSYSMDRDQALRILTQPQQPDLAYRAVQSLLQAGQARLEHASVVCTRNAVKCNCDEAFEDILPTGGNDEWQTQDIGFSGEILPKLIGDGSVLSLDVTKFQFLKDIGPTQGGGLFATLTASQPIFQLQGLTTQINAAVGEHALLGTISTPGSTGIPGVKDDGRVWLAFIRATVINP